MAPPKYILYYFDNKGRAEAVRYMFAYKKQDYEDRRIPMDQWPAIKSQMPAGQLPVLETGGKKLSQSVAIARYVGHELGLYPSSSWDNAKLDEAVDMGNDVMADVPKWFKEQDPAKKEDVRKELTTQTFPPKLTALAQLIGVSDQQPFITGKKPMWGDFMLASLLEFLDGVIMQGQLGNVNKSLFDYVNRIKNLENVKEYVAQRKPTPM